MKNFFLFTLICLTLSCEKKTNEYIIISGQIKNANVNLELSQNSDKLAISSRDKEPIHNIVIDKDGTFRDTLYLDKGHYSLYYEGEKAFIYLNPGDDLKITFDIKDFDNTLTYSGRGSNENNYLIKKLLKEYAIGDTNMKSLAKLNEAEFVEKINFVKEELLTFLDNQKKLSKEFKEKETKRIEYEWVNRINQYEPYKRYVNKNPNFKVSNSFPQIPKELINYENEQLLNIKPYQVFIRSHYNDLAIIEKKKDTSLNDDIAYFKAVKHNAKKPVVKNYLLFKKAMYGINSTNDIEDYYKTFMAESSNEEHKDYIAKKYELLTDKPKTGTLSPSFIDYETHDGKTFSLTDFSGKILYIDIWATWCAPCKKEFPYLKELEEKYKNENIQFISISIDKLEAKQEWKELIYKQNLSGVQLIADNDWNSDFIKKYAVKGSGIPRFILIDHQGHVIDADAPRPSNPKLTNILDKLLKTSI